MDKVILTNSVVFKNCRFGRCEFPFCEHILLHHSGAVYCCLYGICPLAIGGHDSSLSVIFVQEPVRLTNRSPDSLLAWVGGDLSSTITEEEKYHVISIRDNKTNSTTSSPSIRYLFEKYYAHFAAICLLERRQIGVRVINKIPLSTICLERKSLKLG